MGTKAWDATCQFDWKKRDLKPEDVMKSRWLITGMNLRCNWRRSSNIFLGTPHPRTPLWLPCTRRTSPGCICSPGGFPGDKSLKNQTLRRNYHSYLSFGTLLIYLLYLKVSMFEAMSRKYLEHLGDTSLRL